MIETLIAERIGGAPLARREAPPVGLPTGPAAREVAEILVMYSCIERWIDQLDAGERARLAVYPDRRFRGFRPRGEAAYFNAAMSLIGESGFFDEFAGRELRAAVPMLERYRPLLARFDAERLAGLSGQRRSFDQLRRLLGLH